MVCSFLDFLNPLSHMSPEKYSSFITMLFATIFRGVGAKILSVAFFALAFWMLFRRENVQAFVSFLLISLFFAYSGGLLGSVF
ncbi:hypothetical protein Hipma_0643 [Hippea maritima DSM 10411]|uniref:Uncharacterized protein n=2 Tax=Hippea TaxID=84404 RepID=F2LV29_HIPMA|nr:hypothetical protein Hipma_0643 [Hippea maritima DSM 10411]